MTGEKIQKMKLHGPTRAAFFLTLLATVVGCDAPRYLGPQIQGDVPGFLNSGNVSHGRVMFPDRPVVHFDAWVRTDVGSFDGIYITGHAGTTSQAEIEEARERAMALPTDRKLRYGELEVGEIDERTAMAWMEVWEDNGLHEVTFRTVIPYDTITYVVEFLAGNPIFKSNPEDMREIVATFAIGETEWNMPIIALVIAFSLLVLTKVGSRVMSAPYSSAQNYNLPTFAVEEVEGGSGERAGSQARDQGPPEGSAPV